MFHGKIKCVKFEKHVFKRAHFLSKRKKISRLQHSNTTSEAPNNKQKNNNINNYIYNKDHFGKK